MVDGISGLVGGFGVFLVLYIHPHVGWDAARHHCYFLLVDVLKPQTTV